MCDLFITDIHADISSLNAVLALTDSDEFKEKYGSIEKIYNLGDVMDGGYHPAECVHRLSELPNLVSVIGNHDEAFLGKGDVSGSNYHSRLIHQCLKQDGTSFFDFLPTRHVDMEKKLVTAHGGILDIEEPENDPAAWWLHSHTWQRLTSNTATYDPCTGYYYTADMAIRKGENLVGHGAIIVCGHNHHESAYELRGKTLTNKLQFNQGLIHTINNVHVHERRIPVTDDAGYVFIVGSVGIEGIRDGWSRTGFGLLWKDNDQKTFSLFGFKPRTLYTS